MINIVFIIRSLNFGGAERQLLQLVRSLDHARYAITVLTFYDGGELRPELEATPAVSVISLGKSGRWDLAGFLTRLVKTTRSKKPQIVHGYLDVGNIFSLLAGKLAGAKVVFGLRAASMDFSNYDWTMGGTYRLSLLLSRFADRVIVNSQAGLAFHIRQGLVARRAIVIQNGIDTDLYTPNRASGEPVRKDWNIAVDEKLVGIVARIDPQKDHASFLRAASQVQKTIPGARFVCVGEGHAEYRQRLQALAKTLNLENLIWAGGRSDMSAVYNALDLLVLCSLGEGFPNVVAEAMACGTPCVVTDAGDSAAIVADTGSVVPVNDPDSLAAGIIGMLNKPAAELQRAGELARKRIVENYGTRALALATQQVFEELAGRP